MRSRQREVVTPETFRYEIHFQRLSASEVIKIFLKKEKEYNAIKKGDRGTVYLYAYAENKVCSFSKQTQCKIAKFISQ
ncbi:hypothetical protein ARSQ2_01297 [Arsenophonus endosymbiont of Bemisia tabaci Q2]|nr:hypothetical protein ARSQ2_01297 [Arsenophonus endosymbiont of Bemisia tabaci Q2]